MQWAFWVARYFGVGRDSFAGSPGFCGDATWPLMQRAFRTPAGARVTFSLLAQRESNQREMASSQRLATRLEGAVSGCGNLINLGLHETTVRLRSGFFNVPLPRGNSVIEASFWAACYLNLPERILLPPGEGGGSRMRRSEEPTS